MEKSIYDNTNFLYLSNCWRCTCKKPWGNNIIRRLLLGIWFLTQREDGADTSRQWLPKETAAPIRMLYKNMEVKVRLPDGDTDYLDIAANVLQGDTLTPYLIIFYQDYVVRTSINLMKIRFQAGKGNIPLLENTPAQAESLLRSL